MGLVRVEVEGGVGNVQDGPPPVLGAATIGEVTVDVGFTAVSLVGVVDNSAALAVEEPAAAKARESFL